MPIYELYQDKGKQAIKDTDDEAITALKPDFGNGQVLIKWDAGKLSIISYTKDKEGHN